MFILNINLLTLDIRLWYYSSHPEKHRRHRSLSACQYGGAVMRMVELRNTILVLIDLNFLNQARALSCPNSSFDSAYMHCGLFLVHVSTTESNYACFMARILQKLG